MLKKLYGWIRLKTWEMEIIILLLNQQNTIMSVMKLIQKQWNLCYGRNYLYDDIDRICIFSPDCSSISYKMAHFNQCIFLNAYFVGHDGMCYANVFDLLEG